MQLCTLPLTLTPANAEVGETVEQCDKRYGQPLKITANGTGRLYSVGQFFLVVTFSNNVAWKVTYAKGNAGTDVPLTHDEKAAILATYGLSSTLLLNQAGFIVGDDGNNGRTLTIMNRPRMSKETEDVLSGSGH